MGMIQREVAPGIQTARFAPVLPSPMTLRWFMAIRTKTRPAFGAGGSYMLLSAGFTTSRILKPVTNTLLRIESINMSCGSVSGFL